MKRRKFSRSGFAVAQDVIVPNVGFYVQVFGRRQRTMTMFLAAGGRKRRREIAAVGGTAAVPRAL